MLRTRLLTATAAVALFTGSIAFAQDTQPVAPAVPATTTQAVEATTPASGETVIDRLRSNGQFTTLVAALDATQLTETLRTQPAISIFAPTDAAFALLPEAERTRLMDPANVNELRQLLLYHVVVANVTASQIEGTKGGVETAASTQIQLDGTGEAIKVDDATVLQAEVDASNGAIFPIDKVLNPGASLVASGDADEATTALPAEDATMTPPAVAADEVSPPPADEATTPTPLNAPNGQPAATAPTASPPVVDETDGEADATPDATTPHP